jgi:flagellar hook-basal body complex protein FliE
MSSFLNDVNNQHAAANDALRQLVTGEADNVHDVVLSMAKADLAFRMVLEIRNRLTESYQEIMRMQV